MSEIIKIVFLLAFKVVLTRAGFLGGNRNDRNSNRLLDAVLGDNRSSPLGRLDPREKPARSEEVTALITGLINLCFTAIGCLLIKHTINSLGRSIKSAISDSQTQAITPNITKYLQPNVTLNTYELQIVENGLILPNEITFDFKNIGGLTYVKRTLEELADDFASSSIKSSSLLQPIAGFLLFGPPGNIYTLYVYIAYICIYNIHMYTSYIRIMTLYYISYFHYTLIICFLYVYVCIGCGKTALAKSFCKRLNIPMISITPSVLLRKYVGETSQLIKALFSLSIKLAPCMLFIDEMDSMFRARAEDDHPVFRYMYIAYSVYY